MHWLKTTVTVRARVETPLSTRLALAKDGKSFGLSGRYALGTLNATVQCEIYFTLNGARACRRESQQRALEAFD